MGKTVLITGVGGFVGSHLSRKLIESGHEVHGGLKLRSDLKRPKRLEQQVGDLPINLHYMDVTQFTAVADIIQKVKPQWLFHLASQSFVPESTRNPIGTFETNCRGTQNVIEAVRLFSPETRIIFAGSSEEYGKQDRSELPINEYNTLRPLSTYAVSKVFGDNICRQYFLSFGTDTVVSRAFNHEGAGRGDHFVTSSIVRQLISIKLGESDSITVGDTSVTRDWSHVEDVISGYILLAEKAESGSIYVQGTGIETSIDQFTRMACEELGMNINDINIQHNPDLMRPSDIPNLQADPTKIRRLGFENKFTVKDIIRDQIVYYSDPENRKHIIV